MLHSAAGRLQKRSASFDIQQVEDHARRAGQLSSTQEIAADEDMGKDDDNEDEDGDIDVETEGGKEDGNDSGPEQHDSEGGQDDETEGRGTVPMQPQPHQKVCMGSFALVTSSRFQFLTQMEHLLASLYRYIWFFIELMMLQNAGQVLGHCGADQYNSWTASVFLWVPSGQHSVADH